MTDLTSRCSFHLLNRDLHWYAQGEMRDFTECLSTATHYVAVGFRAGDFDAEKYTNLCAHHEEVVRRAMGWKWSRPRRVDNASA